MFKCHSDETVNWKHLRKTSSLIFEPLDGQLLPPKAMLAKVEVWWWSWMVRPIMVPWDCPVSWCWIRFLQPGKEVIYDLLLVDDKVESNLMGFVSLSYCYCWWFRNPQTTTVWMVLEPVENNGISTIPFPQLVFSPDFWHFQGGTPVIQWNDGEVTGDCLIYFQISLDLDVWRANWHELHELCINMQLYMHQFMMHQSSLWKPLAGSNLILQKKWFAWHQVWYRADGSDGECCSLHLGWKIVEMKGWGFRKALIFWKDILYSCDKTQWN